MFSYSEGKIYELEDPTDSQKNITRWNSHSSVSTESQTDKDHLRKLAIDELGLRENEKPTTPPGLMSKEITPFEWQVLEKVIMLCLYFKKEMPLENLQEILFERDPRLEMTFRLQFGSLHQFVKRHGRVFFIHRNGSHIPDVSLKIDFVRQLLLSRNGTSMTSVEHNTDMLIDENLEKEIIRMAIQILYSQSQANCTIGKLGQILHRRMNNPRLPRMFKHTYGGLKKFFERQSTIFCIKKDHLYNPIITLNKPFRALLEDQMAKDRENERSYELPRKEDKASRSTSPRNRNRSPLTITTTAENLPRHGRSLEEKVMKTSRKSPFRKIQTVNWSNMVNSNRASKPFGERKMEDEMAWLNRLPQQLS